MNVAAPERGHGCPRCGSWKAPSAFCRASGPWAWCRMTN